MKQIKEIFLEGKSLTLIILITVMGLYNKAFKNYKKLTPPYKERGSSLDKCLSL